LIWISFVRVAAMMMCNDSYGGNSYEKPSVPVLTHEYLKGQRDPTWNSSIKIISTLDSIKAARTTATSFACSPLAHHLAGAGFRFILLKEYLRSLCRQWSSVEWASGTKAGKYWRRWCLTFEIVTLLFWLSSRNSLTFVMCSSLSLAGGLYCFPFRTANGIFFFVIE